jgi:hypothetical protein
MSARKCQGCGAAVTLRENGDLVCFNGHSQPEAVGDLVRAMAELVAGPLRELRATIEEQGIGLQSLHEEVERSEPNLPPPSTTISPLRRGGSGVARTGCATMRGSWAGRSVSRGAAGGSCRRLRTRGSLRSRKRGACLCGRFRRRGSYPRASRCWT